MERTNFLQQLISYFPPELQPALQDMPNFVRYNLQEIRIRSGQPVMLVTGKENLILLKRGQVSRSVSQADLFVSRDQLQRLYEALCDYSVHSHEEELKNGFLTIPGGHRIGVCGTFLTENKKIYGLKDITSVNIRIAREVFGAADGLFDAFPNKQACSFLLVGAPSSGKTTILRDFVRQISDGVRGPMIKTAVIDERGEISAAAHGRIENHLGASCDVYYLCPKAQGMEMAIRTGSPQFLVCDELGSQEETDLLLQCMASGVKTAATVHGESFEELFLKKPIEKLIASGVFQQVVLLEKNGGTPGKIREVLPAKELMLKKEPFGWGDRNAESGGRNSGDRYVQFYRNLSKQEAGRAGDTAGGGAGAVQQGQNLSGV